MRRRRAQRGHTASREAAAGPQRARRVAKVLLRDARAAGGTVALAAKRRPLKRPLARPTLPPPTPSYANAKVYKCPTCERPACYRTYSSSKEDSPPCEL